MKEKDYIGRKSLAIQIAMNWVLIIIGVFIGILDLLWFVDLAVDYQLASNAFPLSIFAVLAIGLILVGKRMD